MATEIQNGMTTERIHELGAKRHPHLWFTANAAAARWIELPFRVDDPAMQRQVAHIVLRVLDATNTADHEAKVRALEEDLRAESLRILFVESTE